MERRKFIKTASGISAAAAVASLLPATSFSHPLKNQEVISHYVLFWLNDGLTEKEITDFTGFFEELRSIPNIKSFHYGRPAPTHKREVVDNSFSYNLQVQFESLDHINVYETHPIHLKAIEKYSKFWHKVVVHDSVLKS